MSTFTRTALALLIIGGINWGLISLFQFDLVASIFGGQDAFLSRLVYGLVGLSALVCLGLLFRADEEVSTVSATQSRFSNPNLGTEFSEEPNFANERERDDEV